MPRKALSAQTIYYLIRSGISFFFQMWLTVTLLYHTTVITTDPLQLILLGVVLEGTTFLFEIPTGLVADSYSRKWSIIIGVFLMSIAYFLEGMFALYTTVLIAHFIHGLGSTFYSGATDAWLADEIGTEAAAPVFVRGSQLGLLAGQAGILSAILIGQAGLHAPLQVAGIGFLGIGVLLILFMHESNSNPEKTSNKVLTQIKATFQKSVTVLRVRPGLMMIVWLGLITGLSVGGYDRLFTPHFLLNFNPPFEPVVWFGLLTAVVSLSSALILEWIRRRAKLMSPEAVPRSIALLYAGTIVGNVIFVLAGQFWLAVLAFWFSQMLRSTSRPLIVIWINQLAESRTRATAISMYFQANAFGQILGAPVIGLIGQLFTLQIALMSAVLALSPAIWLLNRKSTTAQPDMTETETQHS